METVVDKTEIAFEIARLKGNVEQWEWERRKADRDRYYANVSKKAGAGLLAFGLLVILLSYLVTGIYMILVGLVIMLISVVQEGGARDRLENLDAQLAYGKRRLAELDAQWTSRADRLNNGGE